MSKSRSMVPLALSGPLAGSGPAGNRRLRVAALPVPFTVMLVLVGVLALSLLPLSSSSSSSSDTPSRGSVLVRTRGDSMVGVGVGVGGGAGGGSARSSSIRSFTSNSTDPQTRTGFFIGTNPSEADVVFDGVPTAAFNDPNQPFTLPEVNNSFSLFLWATHVDGFSDDMTYNSTFDPDSSAPFWYNVADVQVYGRLWSSLYADTGALEIDVVISCWINGLQPVTVTLDIQSENEQIWYKRVVFYFQKQCTMPSFDVSVITSQSINRIIIANDFLGNYFSPAAAQIDTFLVGLNPNSTITQHGFRVQVYQPWWPQAAAVEVEANPASGFIFGLGDNAAVQIKVNYTCAEDQATNSTIDVLVSFDWIGGLYLGYTKECNTLKPSTIRTGFWIDDAEYDPIVYSGKPNERFTNPLQPFTLSEFNESLIFNIYLSHVPGHSDQAFYNSTVQATGGKIAQVTETGKMASFIYAGAPAQRIALGFLCLRNGLQQLTLKLNIRDQPNLNPNYAQIVLYFQKQCQMPSFDVSVMSSSVTTPQAIIVNNSRVAPGTGTGTDENWNYVSPTAVEADTFLIGLNNQSAVNEHSFTITNLKYDSKFVSVHVMPATGFISGLGDSARVKIVVNYTCAANQTSNTTVSWILDYGWESQFAIEYTKMCDTFPPPFTTQAPLPPNPDSSTAWTTGAIAAFSAIILVFAFFLIGSLYKYFIQKKRGCDIIPGITLCRKCCGKCGSMDSDSDGQTLLDTQHEYVAPKERGGVNI